MVQSIKIGTALIILLLNTCAWPAASRGMEIVPVGRADFSYRLNQRGYLIDQQDSQHIIEIFNYLKDQKSFAGGHEVQGVLPAELMWFVAGYVDFSGLSAFRALDRCRFQLFHRMWWQKKLHYWGARILNDRALPATIRGFLDMGLDPNTCDQFGKPLLYKSSYAGCKLLLEFKASVNFRGKSDLTSLHCAAMNRNKKKAELFLKAGAGKELKDRDGLTPAQRAYEKGFMSLGQFITNFPPPTCSSSTP